jgi:hypothetical protein
MRVIEGSPGGEAVPDARAGLSAVERDGAVGRGSGGIPGGRPPGATEES